ncbi:MAG: cohesin domain-containing protein [Patescibacteria group bacterium]
MKRMSVMAVAVGLFFVFIGCGRISPTGPSEAVAANVTKSATGTETTATAVLSLSPSQATINVGEEVTVDAVVENVVDLWGIAATVMFDNKHLQFVKAEEGMLLKVQNTTAFMHAIAEWGPNQLAVGLVSLGKVPGVTGYGTLFRVTFKAISSGQSELKFVETALRDSTNSDMKFEQRSTAITVR